MASPASDMHSLVFFSRFCCLCSRVVFAAGAVVSATGTLVLISTFAINILILATRENVRAPNVAAQYGPVSAATNSTSFSGAAITATDIPSSSSAVTRCLH